MGSKTTLRVLFFAAGIVLVMFIVYSARGNHDPAGWMLGLFFFTIGLAFLQHTILKTYTFTAMILAAASLAMYYPQYFFEISGFKLANLVVPLMQIIMFGMGTGLSLTDFARVARMPKGIIIGVCCQFMVMPFIAFLITIFLQFPNEVAAGIILIGSCPGGLASNVMTYLARANLALSVTLTAVSTFIAPVLTPFFMHWLAGEYVTIDFWKMFLDIGKIVILPVTAGLLFNHFLRGRSKIIDETIPILSMVGIGLIIVVITSAGRDELLVVGPKLILAVLVHNICGFFLGYYAAKLLRMREEDRRTIAIEVGLQNAGLGSTLALAMGKIATVGLAAAIFAPVMNITGSTLASWWRTRPPKTTPDESLSALTVPKTEN